MTTTKSATDFVAVSLTVEVVQETLIALRDRYAQLVQEIADARTGEPGCTAVAAISQRQAARVLSAGTELATAVGETF